MSRQKHFCYFCGGAVSVDDGFLTFFDQEAGPPYKAPRSVRFLPHGGREEYAELDYPGNGERHHVSAGRWTSSTTIAVLCHQDCGPDIGYWFDFQRIRGEHEELLRHVSQKPWFFLGAVEAFSWALAAAGGPLKAKKRKTGAG